MGETSASARTSGAIAASIAARSTWKPLSGSQAASRTLIGRLAPQGMSGEFYGLFALSGRATTFMAPFLIGVLTGLSGSNRLGLVVVLVFLIIGFALLWSVREEQAQRVH